MWALLSKSVVLQISDPQPGVIFQWCPAKGRNGALHPSDAGRRGLPGIVSAPQRTEFWGKSSADSLTSAIFRLVNRYDLSIIYIYVFLLKIQHVPSMSMYIYILLIHNHQMIFFLGSCIWWLFAGKAVCGEMKSRIARSKRMVVLAIRRADISRFYKDTLWYCDMISRTYKMQTSYVHCSISHIYIHTDMCIYIYIYTYMHICIYMYVCTRQDAFFQRSSFGARPKCLDG